jgi:transposase
MTLELDTFVTNNVVTMYIDSCTYTANGRQYTRHLLRESYRKDGRVLHRTLANLSHASDEEIQAMKFALQHKGNLLELGNINEDVEVQQGISVGAVWTLWQVAQRIGLVKALGTSQQAKQALWQVFARVLEQGSRLSAVRLANAHVACDVLELEAFNEDDLYRNLDWLSEEQQRIEDCLFRQRYPQDRPELYLYDVTSSYLEGVCNALGAFGYCRDGKKGKLQVVYGLLCDPRGRPVSIEAFRGNTVDTKTFGSQIRKVVDRFGAKAVTMVGDRGMIKGPQIDQLQAEEDVNLHYITAITKPQIEALLKQGRIQVQLFDDTVAEVADEKAGVRYVLRRNPQRAAEMASSRNAKLANVQRLLVEQNAYLAEHPRADVTVARRKIESRHKQLRLPKIKVQLNGRTMAIAKDDHAWQEAAKLDGCYCLKTDLSAQQASKETVHDRYKDLSQVEWAFRTSKTTLLEARPVYVCLESRTRGHLLVVMLGYLLVQELAQCWRDLDLTVEEGLEELKSLCTTQVVIKGRALLHNIPQPRASVQRLLDAAKVTLPNAIADRGVRVSTRKKLTSERKTA